MGHTEVQTLIFMHFKDSKAGLAWNSERQATDLPGSETSRAQEQLTNMISYDQASYNSISPSLLEVQQGQLQDVVDEPSSFVHDL